MEIVTKSAKITREKGALLGKAVLFKKGPIFIALEGDLGGGKTTFIQGFARGLGVKEEVTSPTFLIYKKYKTKGKKFFYHFDAYRVESEDFFSLGFEEIAKDKKNIIAIEWSQRIKEIIPKEAVKIKFSFISSQERKLIIEGRSDIISGIER